MLSQLPINNKCTANNSLLTNLNSMRMDMVQGANAHVKKILPPSLGGMPGEAEIQYYVKATVQRPAFYKENFRAVRGPDSQSSPFKLHLSAEKN